MSSFVFLCDFATESECLTRKLFGANHGEQHQHHYSKIVPGDILFLYNFETGLLRGPYAATTPCKMNIDPTAWKKTRRNFPWQVRVDDSRVLVKPLGADDLRLLITLVPTKMGLLPSAQMTDEQTESVLAAMRTKNPNKSESP